MPMPDELHDADMVIVYLRDEAHAGAQDAKAWRDELLELCRARGLEVTALQAQLVEQAVKMHRAYLETMRSTLLTDLQAPELDEGGY